MLKQLSVKQKKTVIYLNLGGAGGKGTWGAIGEVLSEEDLKIRDQHDPNYESEEDEDVGVN